MGRIFKVGSRTVLLAVDGMSNGNGFANVQGDRGHCNVNIKMAAPPDTGPGMVSGTVRRGSSLGAAIAGAQVVMLAPSARGAGPEA